MTVGDKVTDEEAIVELRDQRVIQSPARIGSNRLLVRSKTSRRSRRYSRMAARSGRSHHPSRSSVNQTAG